MFAMLNFNLSMTRKQESMVFSLITPKFLCPILVKHEVGKRFVVCKDFTVLNVEHSVKALENTISNFGMGNGRVTLVGRK